MMACMNVQAAKYCGRVVDKNGSPLVYATVYPVANPIDGTATNDQGLFCLEIETDTATRVAVTYVGYKQQQLWLTANDNEQLTIVLEDQPIAREEMVIEAKRTRMSKRNIVANEEAITVGTSTIQGINSRLYLTVKFFTTKRIYSCNSTHKCLLYRQN